MRHEFEDEEEITEDDINDIYDDEISDEDYGFIIDSNGDLKSVFMAEHYDEIPEKVYAIFKIFGIDDPEEVNKRMGHTVH